MTAALVAALAVLAALWIAQRLGKSRAERDFAEKAHEQAIGTAARAAGIDDEVARLGDDDVARRLHEYRRE